MENPSKLRSLYCSINELQRKKINCIFESNTDSYTPTSMKQTFDNPNIVQMKTGFDGY